MVGEKRALLTPLASPSTMTPEQYRELYIRRSKERALELLWVGQIREAVASIIMDMRKGPNCFVPDEIHVIGIAAAATHDVALAHAYIEGFN
jgi:hypothetical protein